MILKAGLSTHGIGRMIRTLTRIRDNLDSDSTKLVDVLAEEGADVAQSNYGRWDVSVTHSSKKNIGHILVSGHMPLIAEFGAGDATLTPSSLFELGGDLDFWVWAGSYSLFVGSGDYYRYGAWRLPYTNRWITEVEPHHGLYNAKLYLIEHSADIAREVIKLD